MLSSHKTERSKSHTALSRIAIAACLIVVLSLGSSVALWAQSSSSQQSNQSSQQDQSNQQNQQGQQNQQNTAPAAGGPTGDLGPIAVPKKKEEEPKKEEPPPKPKKVEGMPQYSLRVNVPLVTLDVGVLTKEGMFIPGLKKENFKIMEDGVPQKISAFNTTEAPITAVMLVEFANTFYPFMIDAVRASYVFAGTLKKDDWVALISYDMKEHILTDFTQNKREIYDGLSMLQIPGFSETNLFDALIDTIDRLETVEGRKYIILIASGRDTFSKHTLDQTLKRIKDTKDISIYAVSTGQALREYLMANGGTRYLCNIEDISCRMTYLQADNQMRTFAKMTGGKEYEPLFQAQFREIFADVANQIRNKYSIAYHPTNPAQDGSYRKIKVELVGPDGSPLKVRDEKGHDVKYQIVSREGYKAKQEVE